MYVQGMNLNDSMVRNIYQMAFMKIRIDKTYMGMWQKHAVSSVLKSPIFLIYPKFGHPNVRSDLNRIGMPRNQLSTQRPVYIIWTSTRNNDICMSIGFNIMLFQFCQLLLPMKTMRMGTWRHSVK